jgi:hypothetical protein
VDIHQNQSKIKNEITKPIEKETKWRCPSCYKEHSLDVTKMCNCSFDLSKCHNIEALLFTNDSDSKKPLIKLRNIERREDLGTLERQTHFDARRSHIPHH